MYDGAPRTSPYFIAFIHNFLKLRLSKRAQHEIRDLANMILDELIKIAPSCFEDLKIEEIAAACDSVENL